MRWVGIALATPVAALVLTGCGTNPETLAPGRECPDGSTPVGRTCPLPEDTTDNTGSTYDDSYIASLFDGQPKPKTRNRFARGSACLKAHLDDNPRNDARYCGRPRNRADRPHRPIIPPVPSGKTCIDVTSIDWNWDNDMLCTRPDGTKFFTDYAGARAFLRW